MQTAGTKNKRQQNRIKHNAIRAYLKSTVDRKQKKWHENFNNPRGQISESNDDDDDCQILMMMMMMMMMTDDNDYDECVNGDFYSKTYITQSIEIYWRS